MTNNIKINFFKYSIALVWLVNGLLCKVLNLVPRHEQIVARILGDEFSRELTLMIGLSEVGMAIWFLSGIKQRFNIIAQIGIVLVMNILEFFLVPDLLLWGKLNLFIALLFVISVFYYRLKTKNI